MKVDKKDKAFLRNNYLQTKSYEKKTDPDYEINLRTLLSGFKDNFVRSTWFLRINFSIKFLPRNTFNIILKCDAAVVMQ